MQKNGAYAQALKAGGAARRLSGRGTKAAAFWYPNLAYGSGSRPTTKTCGGMNRDGRLRRGGPGKRLRLA